MQFNPCSAQEIADRKLLPKGVYDFEILDALEKTSGAGNEMIELTVSVSKNGNGPGRTLADYLLPKRPEKLRHCCAACELMAEYDSGSLCDGDFKGKRGRLKLAVEKGRGGYPDRNIIEDYLTPLLGLRAGHGAEGKKISQ
jgi:hypothetical protein